MIEIPRVGRPSPVPHVNSGRGADVFKVAISEIVIERIASRVLAVKSVDVFRFLFLKNLLLRNSDTRGRPHVCHVDVLVPVVVEQEVGRSVARVKIGSGIVILLQPQVIVVKTEVEVEPPVAIIVGNGSVSEDSLWRMLKEKSLAFDGEPSIPLVQK